MRARFWPGLGEEEEDPGAGGSRLAVAPLVLLLVYGTPRATASGGEAGRAQWQDLGPESPDRTIVAGHGQQRTGRLALPPCAVRVHSNGRIDPPQHLVICLVDCSELSF